ncbi:hypothetical protein AB0M39_37315 [Streptomyces sp. NPDC051907]|uniref:hypothetical protein n=1 Tax=Streptomyces sp. NPDC051907 TaxID=3155284 RepID=UPI0034425DD6
MLAWALAAATVLYSAAIVARPVWLAKPCGLADIDGSAPSSTALLIRAIGTRDIAIGTAMLLAADVQTLRTVTACRAASDFGDAALFGAALSGARRWKVAGFVASWGVLCPLPAFPDGTAPLTRADSDCIDER